MLEQFHFLQPLWLLALVPLALLLYLIFRARQSASPWYQLIDPALQSLLLGSRDVSRRSWFLWLPGLGWVVTVLALANPSWSELPRPMLQSTASRVIVLDLSRSMYAADIKPSRIEQARFKVADILRHDNEGQTGLVVFAGDAFTVSPLTRDSETVTTLLMSVSPNIMPVQGSRLGLGLKLAAEMLTQAGVSGGEVIAVTDGYNGRLPVEQAERIREAGHRVSILGMGTTQGAPIADSQGVYVRDGSGNVVIARLDRDKLEAVAQAGGGRYQELRADGSDIQNLLDGSNPSQSEGAVDEGLSSAVWDEKGPWLVLLLLPLAALAFRRGWLLVSTIVVMTGLDATPAQAGWWQDLWWRRDQQAQQAFDQADYDRAREISSNPVVQGSVDYRVGDYETAAETFAADDSADAAYNLGNSLANLSRLQEAVEAYDEALRREPDMPDAIANRAAVLKALEEQQQQQQSGEGEGEGEENSETQGEGTASGESSDSEQSGEGDQSQQDQQSGAGEQQDQASGEDQSESSEQGAQPSDSFSDASEQMEQEQGENGEGEQDEAQSPLSEVGNSGLRDQPGEEGSDAGEASEAEQEGEQMANAEIEAEELSTEEQLAAEQWLRRIPDDPGGLLRRKFRYQYRRRTPPPTDDRETW